MKPDTKANGLQGKMLEMEEDSKFGPTALSMKDIGKTTRPMEKDV